MSRTVVLGVGNPIMTDDAVGLHVARAVAVRLAGRGDVTVLESHRGGMDLVDLLAGFDRAILVDALSVEGHAPGTVLELRIEDFAVSNHLYGAHGIDLVTALALGRALGAAMPGEVGLVGVVVVDACTLGEEMHPPVCAAVSEAADVVTAWIG